MEGGFQKDFTSTPRIAGTSELFDPVPTNVDPVGYCVAQEKPLMSVIAIDTLIIPGSSALSERVFSTAVMLHLGNISFQNTRYMHAHQVPHAEHMERSKWRSLKRWQDDVVLSSTYPFMSQRAK